MQTSTNTEQSAAADRGSVSIAPFSGFNAGGDTQKSLADLVTSIRRISAVLGLDAFFSIVNPLSDGLVFHEVKRDTS